MKLMQLMFDIKLRNLRKIHRKWTLFINPEKKSSQNLSIEKFGRQKISNPKKAQIHLTYFNPKKGLLIATHHQ